MPPPAARMARRGHVPDTSTKQHPGLPPAADKPSVRIRHPVSHAFVGTRGDNAAEYHDNDFAWETLCAAGQEAIRRQQLEASTARPGVDETPPASHDWEEFHAQHSLGRFFKEKRYLPIEFPQLRTPGVVWAPGSYTRGTVQVEGGPPTGSEVNGNLTGSFRPPKVCTRRRFTVCDGSWRPR